MLFYLHIMSNKVDCHIDLTSSIEAKAWIFYQFWKSFSNVIFYFYSDASSGNSAIFSQINNKIHIGDKTKMTQSDVSLYVILNYFMCGKKEKKKGVSASYLHILSEGITMRHIKRPSQKTPENMSRKC